jgi:NADPH dehydrogenase (quinone)
MKNILIICGAEQAGNSEGRFNRSLTLAAKGLLEVNHSVEVTYIADGYEIKTEQEKFFRADTVIFQFPVFWFHCPSSMKKYLDQVYERGVFFERKEPYGTGGLLKNKKYLLSTTWNAPESTFGNMTAFYQGRSVDEALIAMHQSNRYVGMQPLPSFAVHNVVSAPDYPASEAQWLKHLNEVFLMDSSLVS